MNLEGDKRGRRYNTPYELVGGQILEKTGCTLMDKAGNVDGVEGH